MWEKRATALLLHSDPEVTHFRSEGLAFASGERKMLRMKRISDGNRNRFEIIAEILRELHAPTGKTNIMSNCNMSFAQSGVYLNLMMSNGLIETNTTTGRLTYHRTEIGRQFQELYYQMTLLLDPESAFSFRPKIF